MTSKTFHHGDLRNALLAAASEAIESKGVEALSMRALAADIGVSAGAPFRHFASKAALVVAVGLEGLRSLEMDYIRVGGEHDDPWDRLKAACSAYLTFAEEHPELYRIIFMPDPGIRKAASIDETLAEGLAEGMRIFQIFEGIVSDTLTSSSPEEVRLSAVSLWCSMHGLATLKQSQTIDSFIDVQKLQDLLFSSRCCQSIVVKANTPD